MHERTYTCTHTHELNEELGRHRGRDGKCMCNLCGEDCENVDHFLWNCPAYSEYRAMFLDHLKKTLGKEFECFKSCDTAGKSCFIPGTELWGSYYEELLRIVKSYIIYGKCVNQSCMTLALVCCSIEADQGGTLSVRARVSLVSWGGKSCCIVHDSARSSGCVVHGLALRLPFEYLL